MNTVIVTDLDSTLYDVQHREGLAPLTDRDLLESWIGYSKGCVDDTVVPGVAKALQLLAQAGHRIHVVSGRNVEAYDETLNRLQDDFIPVDEIRLHGASDPRHNAEFKIQYINSLFDRALQPILMFEDHQTVGEAIYRATGVPVVSIRPWYTDNVGVSFNLGQHPELAVAK